MTDEDTAGSNSDTESIPYKERYGQWNVENENISKGHKEPVAHTTLNIGGEKVDTQTSESHGNICYSWKPAQTARRKE